MNKYERVIKELEEKDGRKELFVKLNKMGNTLLKLQSKMVNLEGSKVIFLISEKVYNIIMDDWDGWITNKIQPGIDKGDLYEVDRYKYCGTLGNCDIYFGKNVPDLCVTFNYKYLNNKKIEREYESV